MYLFKQGEGAIPKSLLKQKQRILDAAAAEIMRDFRNEELGLLFDMAGVQLERLEQLESGAVPTVQEAIAMLAVGARLAEECEEQTVRYSSALSDWIAQVEKYYVLQLLLVDPLMELTEIQPEDIPLSELLEMLQGIPAKNRGASERSEEEEQDDEDELSEDEDWDDEDVEDDNEDELFDEYDDDPADDDEDEDDADEDDADDPDEEDEDAGDEEDDEEELASADDGEDTEGDTEDNASKVGSGDLGWDKLDGFDWNF